MNKTAVNKFMKKSTASCWRQSNWPRSLVSQHGQLALEIEAINHLLSQGHSSFIHIETRLRKLTKGLLLHLELENCFLVPILEKSEVQESEKNSLVQGYLMLANTCHAISDYFQALKLECGNTLVEENQIQHMRDFLIEIENRLNDESIIYLPVNKSMEATDEI
ncbi:hypothetical protein [Psychromonas sp. Urea-02u-13]|uniref:hypothetical protein n=1 Tax=Psychromonas sp. Urea-02u-13 TaxID=2058326 RepID=UPI000C34F4CC|nr:hypothetical protein [Psychromonas sp. Urea-02u-13]PKG37231.1 hypothetical protein CXF74_19975 [Psychromonas sp. Urea-02u-13]